MNTHETILLVDDTPDNLLVMKVVLQRALPHVEIVTFQKPEEVMAYVRSADVSAAIFDVQMPGMNGIELCGLIKAAEETRHIPVILVTSHEASSGFKAKGLDAGADDFLTRPIDNDKLVTRVKVALRISRAEAQLRRTARQAQAESEQLGHVLENSLNEIFIFDAQTLRFVNANRGARANIGYSIEELRDMTPLDIKPEMTMDAFAELVEPLRAGAKELVQFKTIHRRKNGTLYPVEVHLQLMNYDNSVFVAIILDNTERKLVEDALQKSEELFRSTIDDLLVGVVVHAADSSILVSNSQASHILGLNKEQMAGKQAVDPAWHFVHEDLSVMKVEDYPVSRVISTGKWIVNQILGIKRPDRQETTWVALSAVPVFSDKKVLSRIITNFMDITERKQAVEALQASEFYLRTLINTIPDLVWLKNPEGVFLSCNSMFENLYGAKEEAIAGKTDYDFVSKGLADFFRDHDRKAMEACGSSVNEEHLTFAETGYEGEFETIKTPMYDSEGKLLGVLSVSRDITERKRAETQLAEQFDELRRWREVMVGREDRVIEIKREVNELLTRLGEPPRYASAMEVNALPKQRGEPVEQ